MIPLLILSGLTIVVAICLMADARATRPKATILGIGYFDVTGSHSGRRYRIFQGRTRNVRELGQGDHPDVDWCFGPEGGLVTSDCLLAQKIALESCEPEALQIASRFCVQTSNLSSASPSD
jgi:hypothetical protein